MKTKYVLIFPKFLIKERICVALNKLNMNEFYNSFKYLKHIIASIILNNDESKEGVRKEIKNVAINYNNSEQTIMTAISKFYDKCKKDSLIEKFPKTRNKPNYFDKILILTEYCYKEINKEKMD